GLLSVRCTSLTGRNGLAITGCSSTNSICPSTSAWSVYPGRQVLCDDWWRLSRLPYCQRRGQTMFSATMTNHELQLVSGQNRRVSVRCFCLRYAERRRCTTVTKLGCTILKSRHSTHRIHGRRTCQAWA